jgi:hypothetical protein
VDGFAIFILCLIVAMVIVFLAIGKWYPGSGADVLDWKPTRSIETEIELEQDDVQQMIDAQNERRRRTGRPERSEDEVRAEIADEQERLRRWREDG